MTTILKSVAINASFPFAGRAAQREIVRGLNFTIVNLMGSVIRQRAAIAAGLMTVNASPQTVNNPHNVDFSPLLDKYPGQNTLDKRNKEDAAEEGRDVSDKNREEQGHTPGRPDPRVLAGQLKVIRDSFAANLEKYAVMIPNPMGTEGEMYFNPYEIAEPLMVTLVKQMKRPIGVNKDMIRAQAEALGLDPDDVERIQLRQNEASTKFLKENKGEIAAMFDSLEALKCPEGKEGDANRVYHVDDKYEPGPNAIEDLELDIPAIHRARMYVNADRGFYYERDRWITAMLKRHPEAATHLKILDGCRVLLHKEFEGLMANPRFYKEISDETLNGASWPTLTDLPKTADERAATA